MKKPQPFSAFPLLRIGKKLSVLPNCGHEASRRIFAKTACKGCLHIGGNFLKNAADFFRPLCRTAGIKTRQNNSASELCRVCRPCKYWEPPPAKALFQTQNGKKGTQYAKSVLPSGRQNSHTPESRKNARRFFQKRQKPLISENGVICPCNIIILRT